MATGRAVAVGMAEAQRINLKGQRADTEGATVLACAMMLVGQPAINTPFATFLPLWFRKTLPV